ncbi:MAG TPA: DUF1223 domain-containing protein [Stellaceae bacterium]|jgi:hypothetical protein|nr:DUF1223 domain-containing protein [Stellaceae bacterium]
MLSRLFAVVVLGILSPAVGVAAERPVVVELFTSQGCSSCPPADAFLTELANRGGDILPLAFHVTYWDSLGWKDPFSLKAATELQAAYAGRFGDDSFTPEIVVDGRKGLVGSDRAKVEAAILAARQQQATATPISATQRQGAIAITVGAGPGNARIVVIGYDRRHQTPIGRGENAGRTATDSNVVRSMKLVGDWTGQAVDISIQAPEGEVSAVLLLDKDGRVLGAARTSPAA